VSFRPIVAETDELAWEKAYRTLDKVQAARPARVGSSHYRLRPGRRTSAPSGCSTSPRAASYTTVHCGHRWSPRPTPRAARPRWSGATKPSRRHSWNYVDIGCELLSVRGYDPLNDAIDLGRKRAAAGPPGTRPPRPSRLRKEHPMTVEFVGMIGASYYSEDKAHSGPAIDQATSRIRARLRRGRFDWTLVPYGSSSPESNQLAAAVLSRTER